MSRNAIDSWLEPRLVGAPPELAEAVRGLLGELEIVADELALGVPEALAAAAMLGLEGVLERADPEREVALRLLAADAALTYAFEAAASLGRDVDALALRIGACGELGRRIEQGDAGLPDGGLS
ncbi:MAG: hypothetical protein E4H28_00140 [Gemmatimonadales bacterium]|nr:MAG: hypothetical protein E4H28_00140 [Gemmatimonadales bacterium]